MIIHADSLFNDGKNITDLGNYARQWSWTFSSTWMKCCHGNVHFPGRMMLILLEVNYTKIISKTLICQERISLCLLDLILKFWRNLAFSGVGPLGSKSEVNHSFTQFSFKLGSTEFTDDSSLAYKLCLILRESTAFSYNVLFTLFWDPLKFLMSLDSQLVLLK